MATQRPHTEPQTDRQDRPPAPQDAPSGSGVPVEILDEEALYRAIFENAQDGILLYDVDDQTIVEINRRAADMLESTPEALQGKASPAIHLPSEVQARLTEVAAKGSVLFEASHERTDESVVHVEISATRMGYRGRRVVLCIVRDITEHKRLQRQLEQAQRLESIGRLAGGVAHDFNNLITAIQGFASLLQDTIGDEVVDGVEALTEIIEASRRANGLTRQLLAYSRQQRLDPEPLNLNDLVRSTRRMLDRLIGDTIGIALHLEPDLRAIYADAGQIEQVLMNLVVNARDAMEAGGRLEIETRNATVDEEHAASHPAFTPGEYVVLAVADTGIGMDGETLSRVFDPFFTTKPTGEGTGLGLSTVYGIVKQSGGFIWAYSEPGIGTTFRLYFPMTDLRPRREDVPSTDGGWTPLVGQGRTVLVVEDERPVRSLVRKSLESRGFRVLDADSGAAALELAGDRINDVELLVTDMVMPGMSGVQLAERIEELKEGIPILFMSGYSREFLVRQGDLTRRHTIMEKPFTPAQLLEAVAHILERTPQPPSRLEPRDWKHQVYAD